MCSIIVRMREISADSSEFVVAQPDLQVGLSTEIDRGVRPTEFLNRYHAEYDVRCAFCAGHTPHRRGFTVRLEDGRIALCGIDCASEFFGEEVASRFESDLQTQIKRQTQRKILANTVDGAPVALRFLNDDWIGIESSYFSAIKGINLWVHPEVLRTQISDGALRLMKSRRVQVETVTRDGRDVTKTETVEEVQAIIRGASCLLVQEQSFGLAKGGLAALVSRSQDPDTIKGTLIEELGKKRTLIIDRIRNGLEFTQSAYAFFQEDNLRNFIAWYRRNYRGSPPEITISPSMQLFIPHPEPRGLPTVTNLPGALPDPQPMLKPLVGGG